jgi:hypothetical protein
MYEASGFVPDGFKVDAATRRRATTLGEAAKKMHEATTYLVSVANSRSEAVGHKVKVAIPREGRERVGSRDR